MFPNIWDAPEPARVSERGRFGAKDLCATCLAPAGGAVVAGCRGGGVGGGESRPKDAEAGGGIRAAVQGRVIANVEVAAENPLLYWMKAKYRRGWFRLDDA